MCGAITESRCKGVESRSCESLSQWFADYLPQVILEMTPLCSVSRRLHALMRLRQAYAVNGVPMGTMHPVFERAVLGFACLLTLYA